MNSQTAILALGWIYWLLIFAEELAPILGYSDQQETIAKASKSIASMLIVFLAFAVGSSQGL